MFKYFLMIGIDFVSNWDLGIGLIEFILEWLINNRKSIRGKYLHFKISVNFVPLSQRGLKSPARNYSLFPITAPESS